MIRYSLLPIYNDYAFSYATTLSGVGVRLEFTYNPRTKSYHLTISLNNGDVVVSGKKILLNVPFFTSSMAAIGLSGSFLLTGIDPSLQENVDDYSEWADRFIFSYST